MSLQRLQKKSQTEIEFFRRLYQPRIFGREVLGRMPYSVQEIALLCPHSRQYNSCGRAVGKSTVLIQDNALRRALLIPLLRQIRYGTPQPVPLLCLLVGSTKEQASELTLGMRQLINTNELLASEINQNETTKTQIVFDNGARIIVRPATAGARGLHPPSILKGNLLIKGTMDSFLDEFAFFNSENFLQEVVEPMRNMAGPDSKISLNSTPYGQVGEAYEIWSNDSSGRCLQDIRVDPKTRMPYIQGGFDVKRCQKCMAANRWVLFQFPTYWNPFVDQAELVARKRHLMELDRMDVWDQETEGLPTATSGLFIREGHHRMMWDDTLDEFFVDAETGQWYVRHVNMDENSPVYGAAMQRAFSPRAYRPRGEFYLGLDPNSGSGADESDYAALALIEVVGDVAYLRLCQRFKKAPREFTCVDGQVREYGSRAGDLTRFMLDLTYVIMDQFGVLETWVDSGGPGASYLVPLQHRYNEKRVRGIPSSVQAKLTALTNWRGMIETNRWRSPVIKFLINETKFLIVDKDSLEKNDKMAVHKAKRYGTRGAEVDGLYACAYSCYGLMERRAGVSISSSKIKTRIGIELMNGQCTMDYQPSGIKRLFSLRNNWR